MRQICNQSAITDLPPPPQRSHTIAHRNMRPSGAADYDFWALPLPRSTLRAVEESRQREALGGLRRVEDDAEAELREARVGRAVALGAVDEDALELLGRAVGVEFRARDERALNLRAREREGARPRRAWVSAAALGAPVGGDP